MSFEDKLVEVGKVEPNDCMRQTLETIGHLASALKKLYPDAEVELSTKGPPWCRLYFEGTQILRFRMDQAEAFPVAFESDMESPSFSVVMSEHLEAGMKDFMERNRTKLWLLVNGPSLMGGGE